MRKLCPLLNATIARHREWDHIGDIALEYWGEDCVWYDPDSKTCAVAAIARALAIVAGVDGPQR